jgi:hypothetical protein
MIQATNPEPTLVDVINKLDTLTQDVERSNERFKDYQQAVQWVVQLAFSLIASATITIIISSVLRK